MTTSQAISHFYNQHLVACYSIFVDHIVSLETIWSNYVDILIDDGIVSDRTAEELFGHKPNLI